MGRTFWGFGGAPLLLLISLYGLYSHITERQHRHEVMTRGTQADARVVKSSGIVSVLVAWTDSTGRQTTAEAWTGKPFARSAGAGQAVAIMYIPESTLEPVILSEASERERINEWWTTANIGLAIAMTMVCAVVAGIMLAGRRHTRG
jgi:hypothetical protein